MCVLLNDVAAYSCTSNVNIVYESYDLYTYIYQMIQHTYIISYGVAMRFYQIINETRACLGQDEEHFIIFNSSIQPLKYIHTFLLGKIETPCLANKDTNRQAHRH